MPDITDAATGTLLYKNFIDKTSTYLYSDAFAAYNAWCSSLGLVTSGTISSPTFDYYYTYNALNAGFAVLENGANTEFLITASSGLSLTLNPYEDYQVASTNPSIGGASATSIYHSDPRPSIMFLVREPTVYDQIITDFKWQKSNAGDEVIMRWQMSDPYNLTLKRTRIAIRLRSGYIRVVAENINSLSACNFQIFQWNTTSNALSSGAILAASITSGSTITWESNDLGPLRPRVLENVNFSEVFAMRNTVTARDTFRFFSDTAEGNRRYQSVFTDLMQISRTVTDQRKPGAFMTDSLSILESQAATIKASRTTIEAIQVTDELRRAIPGLFTENMTISRAVAAVRGVTVLEALGLSEILNPSARYPRSFVENVQLSELVMRVFGGYAIDSFTVSSASTYLRRPGAIMSENLQLTSTLASRFVLRITAQDTINLDDIQALKAIYSGGLTDEFEITAAYISPDGNLTTWAINTRTGATTEYQSFEYNSFAKHGHKYLGASTDGLFELNGDTDDGQSIVSQVKSGLLQMAGTHFTQFAGAYLGLRSDGEFILRIEDGDGNQYDYMVTANPVASTKVTLGKGLKARYFSFELISDGSDFDLDSVEFLPLMSKRRV